MRFLRKLKIELPYDPAIPLLHESESGSRSVVSDSLRPHGLYSPWNSPGQNTGVGSRFLLQGNLPNPGIEPRPPALQVDSLPIEPQGKPKNTGVGSRSLLKHRTHTYTIEYYSAIKRMKFCHLQQQGWTWKSNKSDRER